LCFRFMFELLSFTPTGVIIFKYDVVTFVMFF
jgi:hypothetical protein